MEIKIKPIEEIDFSSIAYAQIRATAISPEIGEFRVAHCIRTTAIAIGLSAHEIGSPLLNSYKLVTICQIHDMFKYISLEDHGNAAANWLYKIAAEYGKKDEWKKACKAIQYHTSGAKRDENIYAAYLYEADKLDHISVDYIKLYSHLFMNDELKATVKKHVSKVYKIKGTTKNFNSVRDRMLEKVLDLFPDDYEFQNEIRAMAFSIKATAESVDQENDKAKS